MNKIKDRIILGALSGALTSIVPRTINRLEFEAGLTNIRYNPLAARLFVPKGVDRTSQGEILGYMVNTMNGAIMGVLMTYLLSATGRDHSIAKGAGQGAIAWVFINGVISRSLVGTNKKPWSPILSLISHIAAGALNAKLITWLGDDCLFPLKVEYGPAQTPLIHTGQGQSAGAVRQADPPAGTHGATP